MKFKSCIFMLFALPVLTFSAPIQAKTVSHLKLFLDRETQDMSEPNEYQLQKLFRENKEYFLSADFLLDRLLIIPYEKRQYYFPAVHAAVMIPHKITSHPQVIVWKDKKPTVLPPELTEFAEKHLEYLPAAFYRYLDPDIWAKPEEKTVMSAALQANEQNPTLLTDSGKVKPVFNRAKTMEELYPITRKKAENFTKTDLTDELVGRTLSTLIGLPDYAKIFPEIELVKMRSFFTEETTVETLVNPVQEWVKNAKKTQLGTHLDEFIQAYGWKNTDDFAKNADRIIKAYRVSQLTLRKAISAALLRKMYPIRPNEPLLIAQIGYLIYDAEPGDALFMRKFDGGLKKILASPDLKEIAIPILLD